MRKYLLFIVSFCIVACTSNSYVLEVTAPTDSEITNRVYEVAVDDLSQITVFDSHGVETPSQITYDGKLLILANVKAGATEKYRVSQSAPSEYPTIACGKLYPEKLDDLAWENDKIAFRIYGKPNIEEGNKLYGYDIFTKRGENPVLEDIYAPEIDPFNAAEMVRLREVDVDMVAYEEFIRPLSYHLDHGKGMDYYAVGPTMGCGTAALVVDGKSIYPTYYAKQEILDNGPLRFTARVEFDPVEINGEEVTEQRTITLDAGTHFNKIDVQYLGLSKPTDVVVGIVLHDAAKNHQITDNSIAYIEPMHSVGWQTYNAVIFDPAKMSAKIDLFDDAERAAHGGAFGHIQAEGKYSPESTLTYYMGAGWNGWEVFTPEAWYEIVNKESKNLTIK